MAKTQQEANVFHVAAMLIGPHLPVESEKLMQGSTAFFSSYPDQKLDTSEVLQKGWILSLPRFSNMLKRMLSKR